MSMRKVCAACLTALFAAGTATALQAADAAKTAPSTFKPGTYTATVNGHNAPVTVKVTVSKNRIEKIDTSKNLETIGVGRVALKLMTDKILKYQSLGVDAITGASISSLALLSGVEKCLEQAGGNIDKLTEQVEKHPAGTKTYDADVVVIGGGGSGASAAIEAHEAGANVMIVTKLRIGDANTMMAEGGIQAADKENDSPVQHYLDCFGGGHFAAKPELVKRLFESEVTEIKDGTVEIKSIAREAGSRTKIAVWSNNPNVDAVGACVGMNGARVNAIVEELRGEKIDIVNWDENPGNLIQNALSPAKIVAVFADPDEKTAKVVVPDYQLSLAIGKEGQNARLAARLTGYKIDIKSETQAKDAPGFRYEDYVDDYEDETEDDFDGEQE